MIKYLKFENDLNLNVKKNEKDFEFEADKFEGVI